MSPLPSRVASRQRLGDLLAPKSSCLAGVRTLKNWRCADRGDEPRRTSPDNGHRLESSSSPIRRRSRRTSAAAWSDESLRLMPTARASKEVSQPPHAPPSVCSAMPIAPSTLLLIKRDK